MLLCGGHLDIQEDCYNLALCRQHLQGLEVRDLLTLGPKDVMSPAEKARMQVYVADWLAFDRPKCAWQDLICHLGDNPGAWRTWSAISMACPTLRRSSGIMAAPAADRQVLLKELYAGMGFPSFPHLAHAAQVPIYQVFKPMQRVTYSHMRQALGNSQVVPQVGVFAACALASARLRDP